MSNSVPPAQSTQIHPPKNRQPSETGTMRHPIDPPRRMDGGDLSESQIHAITVRDWILIGGSIAMIGALCMARFVWIPLIKSLL